MTNFLQHDQISNIEARREQVTTRLDELRLELYPKVLPLPEDILSTGEKNRIKAQIDLFLDEWIHLDNEMARISLLLEALI